MYKTLTDEQIYRFYPGKESAIKKLLTRLTQQGRVFRNHKKRRYSINTECDGKIDPYLIAAVWVLIDFIDKVEYHYASDFPVKICFFADGEIYEIIHVPYEQEMLMNHALTGKSETDTRRIVLIDSPEQIGAINIPNISGFCSVDSGGRVQYYKLE
jgi:hypothetical protein